MSDPVEAVKRDVGAIAAALSPAGSAADRSALARTALAGLAERRLPTEAEIDAERRFGESCAGHGIPAESMVAAYHLGFRRIWEKLVEYAGDRRPSSLLDLADLLWSWLPLLATAAADGYEQAREAAIRRDIDELVDLLSTGQADTESCRALAHAVGFDPDGDFQVVAVPEPDSGDGPRNAAWVVRDGRILVIHAGAAEGPADPLGPAVGISLVRPGLAGAAAALLDAESALDLAVALQRPIDFRADWLWITILRHLDRLRPLLGAGRPADQPQLGEAARAYGDGGWSIAGAAGNSGLHPNTLRYRLERLGQLANLDPRSIAGQRLSVLQDLVNEVDANRRPG